MAKKGLQVPKDGQAITMTAKGLQVPDRPIIPTIRGDGTGVDISPVMLKVVDAAVEKAYKGKKKIAWMKVYAGDEAISEFHPELHEDEIKAIPPDERQKLYLPDGDRRGDQDLPRRDQGPAHDPGGRRDPKLERHAPSDPRPLRLRPAGEAHRDPGAGARAGEGQHGLLPREHRGRLHRNRVEGRLPRGGQGDRLAPAPR